ncbi:MAG: CPBP family intramembrane glutamic endopeptidase [Nitrospinales bacterium]
MVLKKVELTGTWGLKLPFALLSVYLFFLYPAARIFLPPQVSEYCYDIFLAAVLFYLLWVRKISPADLGIKFRHYRQNLLIGGLAGAAVLLALPALDGFVSLSGLEQTELLAESAVVPHKTADPLPWVILILLRAVMEQIFFSGFVVQALLKKYNPFLVIYAAGALFALLHFTFNLGTFAIGLITAYGYYLTGTLVAPLAFQVSCRFAGVLLETVYPRLITLTGFLF